MKLINIVMGLGFGDEGKGRVVDGLSDSNTLVIRFNGGPQAGHTVYKDNKPHIFSSFGSGTLKGAATYWSSYCPFNPIFYMNELDALKEERGIITSIFISSECPLITVYDIAYNRALENTRGHRHGSCGHGVGATIERHQQAVKVFVRDLQYPRLLPFKLNTVREYYDRKIGYSNQLRKEYSANLALINTVELDPTQHLNIVNESEFLSSVQDKSIVFEGAQGILLDQDYGFFPHVTRSYATSKNALELVEKYNLGEPIIDYVTRSYLTRHGNGPIFTDPFEFNSASETNKANQWQEEFRTGILQYDLLKYALDCDRNYSNGLTSNLIVTHMDQPDGSNLVPVMKDKILHNYTPRELATELGIGLAFTSSSPHSGVGFKYISK